ncbi:hypothetical protein HAX54_025490 [Datura stramonium]|uniref:Zinc finger C3HC4 RING-type domain-containing protein n=1 Tax=Datura stramonium TaxID=4076 RepID=A0ABS8V1N4_DATST|nr:hypothetical protein [Datura stramonium]
MDRPHLRRRRNQNLTDKKAAGDDISKLTGKGSAIGKKSSTRNKANHHAYTGAAICSEPRPVVNDIYETLGCGHIYCEECIISYARERIRENIMEWRVPSEARALAIVLMSALLGIVGVTVGIWESCETYQLQRINEGEEEEETDDDQQGNIKVLLLDEF